MSPEQAAATHKAVDQTHSESPASWDLTSTKASSTGHVSRAHAALSSLPLPAGWEARLCASPRMRTRAGSHRVVFLHHEKRVTTWNDPRLRLLLPPSLHTLPVGWTLDLDKDGEPYFLDDTTCTTCRRPSWLSAQQHEDLNRFYKHYVISAAADAALQALGASGHACVERQCPPYTAPPQHHSHSHERREHNKSDGSEASSRRLESLGSRPYVSTAATASPPAVTAAPPRERAQFVGAFGNAEAHARLLDAGPPPETAWHDESVHAGTASALLFAGAHARDHGGLHSASGHNSDGSNGVGQGADEDDGLRGVIGLHAFMCEAWPLPDGWTGHTCPESGQPYFVHAGTRRVTWTHPALAWELAGVHAECLPEDWDVDFDADGLFFVNHPMQMATRRAPEPLISMATGTRPRLPTVRLDGPVRHASRRTHQDSTTTIVPEDEDWAEGEHDGGENKRNARHGASPPNANAASTAGALRGVHRDAVDLLARRGLPMAKVSLSTQRALSDSSMDSGLESGPVTGTTSTATSATALCRHTSISQASLGPREGCPSPAPNAQRDADGGVAVAWQPSCPPAQGHARDGLGSDTSSAFSVSSLASYLTSMWSGPRDARGDSKDQAVNCAVAAQEQEQEQEQGEQSHVTVHFV